MFEDVRLVQERLERIARGDAIEVLDLAQTRRALQEVAAIERALIAVKTALAGRAADLEAWKGTAHRNGATFMASTFGTTVGDGSALLDTAVRVRALPATQAALREGALSESQLRVVAATAADRPEAEERLLAAAREHGAAGLREESRRVRAEGLTAEEANARHLRAWRNRSCREWVDDDGAFHLHLRSTIVDGAEIAAQLDVEQRRQVEQARREGRREPYDAYRADALRALLQRAARVSDASEPGTAGPRATVFVTVDLSALLRGHVETAETCEIPGAGPVPVATARALLTDSVVTLLATDGRDVTTTAHLGRTIPTAVRRALVARDPTCCILGCTARADLEIDHVEPFALGGPTRLDNLRRLCRKHHRLKTYAGFRYAPTDVPHRYALVPPGARHPARAGPETTAETRPDARPGAGPGAELALAT